MTIPNTTERRLLSELKPYPKQDLVFGDLPEAEFAALVASLKDHGQRDPIHVLPDDTVLKGHQRARAAKALGWPDIEVIVRYDLADDPYKAELEFIEDNACRRQLDPLAQARCMKHLIELEKRRPRDGTYRPPRGPLRDRVAKLFGCSGRNVDRHLQVLEAPLAVQLAFSAGRLPLVVAEQIARLPAEQQQRIAAAIEAGEDPRRVAAAHLQPKLKATSPAKVYARLLGQLEVAFEELDGKVGSIRRPSPRNSAEILARGAALIEQLQEHERPLRK